MFRVLYYRESIMGSYKQVMATTVDFGFQVCLDKVKNGPYLVSLVNGAGVILHQDEIKKRSKAITFFWEIVERNR